MTESEVAGIQERNLLLRECLPSDFSFLESYQETVYGQILWDDDSRTIRGKNPKQYMLDGLKEELDELISDGDRVEPAYNRFGALLLLEGTPKAQPGLVTETAVQRHLKEFGDVSWYLANYLSLFDIRYPKVIKTGLLAWQLDKVSQPRCPTEFTDEVEGLFPWLMLISYAGELTTASIAIAEAHRDGRISGEQQLVIAAGKFTLSMMHMAVNRFNTTYEAILQTNLAKLERRMRQGTIFDKSGGDDR